MSTSMGNDITAALSMNKCSQKPTVQEDDEVTDL